MNVKGEKDLKKKYPNIFNVERKPEEKPARIVITRGNGQFFSYYVATDSGSGVAHPGERAVRQSLELGSGDRALVSPRVNRDSVLHDNVEIMVDFD